jgi:hypothetical protein
MKSPRFVSCWVSRIKALSRGLWSHSDLNRPRASLLGYYTDSSAVAAQNQKPFREGPGVKATQNRQRANLPVRCLDFSIVAAQNHIPSREGPEAKATRIERAQSFRLMLPRLVYRCRPELHTLSRGSWCQSNLNRPRVHLPTRLPNSL